MPEGLVCKEGVLKGESTETNHIKEGSEGAVQKCEAGCPVSNYQA